MNFIDENETLQDLSIELPAEVVIRAPKGLKPKGRTGVTHGFHSGDVVEIPTSLNCSVCPLYHIKKKDRRHKLACPEGRKGQVCPILTRRQVRWAEQLLDQIREETGEAPRATDLILVEQIVRHRSRLFQCENYLKVAGLIDLRAGKVRNVAERMTTVENAMTRTTAELRQAIASRRQDKQIAPTLAEYLEVRSSGQSEIDDNSND